MDDVQTVSLLHVVRRTGNQMVFFYDGALEAHDGVLTLPANRPDWIRRAWASGYNMSPDGKRRLALYTDVQAEVKRQTAKSGSSAKSTEETSEGSRSRRQSAS